MKLHQMSVALAMAGALAVPAAFAADSNERQQLARQLVERWSAFVEDAYKLEGETWAKEMAPAFELASLDELRAANKAGSFDAMNTALLGPAPEGSLASLGQEGARTKVFGDADVDLIYVPVTPCRIFDTRIAGGAIATNTTRSFDVTAVSNYSFQGGAANNCGIGASGSFAAVVINVTTVSPAGQGYITAFPYLVAQPLAATLVYTPGSIVSNEVVLKLDQGASADELSIYASNQVHVVGDVTGYFRNPGTPTLECVNSGETIDSVAAGATQNTVAPVCPATYTQTGTNCETSTWQMPFVYISDGTCSAQNNSGGSAQLRASRTCCRPKFN